MSPRSTLPETQWARPALHSRIAAWKTSVPTTRWGVSRKTTIRARPTSAPEPTDVMPTSRPRTSPIATATTRTRGVRRTVSLLAGRQRGEEHCAPEDRQRDDDERGRDPAQQDGVEPVAVAVVQPADEPDAGERPGDAADGEPPRHAEVDLPAAQQPPPADGLRHRPIGEVGADRHDGVHAREEDEQRRHERPAADPRQAHEHAHAQAEQDDDGIHASGACPDDRRHMQPALGLVQAGPPALAPRAGGGAGRAADRGVALRRAARGRAGRARRSGPRRPRRSSRRAGCTSTARGPRRARRAARARAWAPGRGGCR